MDVRLKPFGKCRVMSCLALESTIDGRGAGELRCMWVRFNMSDDESEYSDRRVGGWDGRVSTGGGDGDARVQVPFFGDTGQRKDRTSFSRIAG